MGVYRSEEDIIENLRDAGCDAATIRAFLEEWHGGKQERGAKLLEKHRRCLLEELHAEQKRIDCLDYLLFQLQRQGAAR